jgi:molecular chaperone GrpE
MNNNAPKDPPEDELPHGFTELSGPAAFKAKETGDSEAAQAKEVSENESALAETVKTLEDALVQSNDKLLRTVADMENLRKRSIREREDAARYAVSGFARDLLDVADNFRRALDSIPAELRSDEKVKPFIEGIEATERAMLRTFEKNGIKKIEPMDEPFNPNFHEVMFETPGTGKPAGTIIQLVETGYMLHDRLLRAARVGVAKADNGNGTAHHIDTQA